MAFPINITLPKFKQLFFLKPTLKHKKSKNDKSESTPEATNENECCRPPGKKPN